MQKYFKEVQDGLIVGQCSISYRKEDFLNNYLNSLPKNIKAIEISKKKYEKIFHAEKPIKDD